MTTPATTPAVIVVAEQEIYDLLASSGAGWDVQHRIETVSQMWDDLSGGRLAQTSSVLVFSDSIAAQPGELEVTLATMAPHAKVFVVAWRPEEAAGLLDRVTAAASQQGQPEAPVYPLLPESGRSILDAMAQVLDGIIGFPAYWPEHVDAALVPAVTQAEPVWEPEPVAAPAPVAAAPVMTAPPTAVVPAYTQAAAPAGEEILAPLPGQVTLAVTSSKGGSGKSTTAMMTAAQIRQSSIKAAEAGLIPRPLKVVLVDMDTRDGQVASLIGRYVPTALNIRVSPQWDQETVLKNLVHDPKLGIDALLAPVRPRTADDVGPDFYRHVIRVLQATHDVVIMDTSVNYLDPLISTVCLPESTAILFVTTLATTSVQGMARALREITEPADSGGMGISRKKIGIVVNQSVTEVGMERDQVLQAALSVPIVGAIPLATRDVLTATNYNRMHLLLKHPLLGPAYHRLAAACLKNVPLPPLIADSNTPAVAAPAAPAAVSAPVAAAAPEAKRGGLFGRKG